MINDKLEEKLSDQKAYSLTGSATSFSIPFKAIKKYDVLFTLSYLEFL